MKAAFLTGIRKFEIRSMPDPEIANDTDVLVRIRMVGVCGSDVHYYRTGRIGPQVIEFPFIFGHEAAGVVEQTGKAVTRVKAGQRVAIDPTAACGRCDQCRSGRENTCRNLLFVGCPKQLDGALREFAVLPETCCFPVGNGTSFERAVLSEPLAIAVYSVEKSRLPAGGSAAVLGAGPIGMSVLHVLRTRDAGAVYVTDKIDSRLGFAAAFGPKWTGHPENPDAVDAILRMEPLQLDAVYECSGDIGAVLQAVRLLKPGGTLALIGIPEQDTISFPIHELRRKEITLLN
ncbi:alcohol dehydrogenase catalytic domain-containing protein, partial [bacterium]|nr:alcohol dehydrogenase catalytic domain-containing protein [bacterium]